MSGMGFPSKATGSAATQTVWFGTIIDRLTMLMPYNSSTGRNVNNTAAHFGNLLTPINSSFGAFTTAPDGTTNVAQLLVEDGTTNQHYIQGGLYGFKNSLDNMSLTLRLAAFLKAGTRTRVGFNVLGDPASGQSPTLTVVFDLVGGQVGVPATIGGGSGQFNNGLIIATGTQIIALPSSFGGGGWYLCMQDFYYQDDLSLGVFAVNMFLDSGSGTGALSQSYAGNGNGTTGAYVWRTNLMPQAAWGINNTVFFDDFNSISTIDINNTKAPGFNWYCDCTWATGSGQSGVTTAANVSVSGSILTVTGPCTSPGGFHLQSAALLGAPSSPTAIVGNVFGAGKATLYESRVSWDYATAFDSGGQPLAWWAPSSNSISGLDANASNGGREFDWLQGGNVNYANTDALGYFPVPINVEGLSAGGVAAPGFPAWSSAHPYRIQGGDYVYYTVDGNVYVNAAAGGNNLNHVPASNPSFWTQLSYPSTVSAPALQVDYTQMHVYSNIVIPYWGQPGISGPMRQQSINGNLNGTPDAAVGIKLSFFDGVFCNISGCWGANLPINRGAGTSGTGSFLFNSDYHNLVIAFSPGSTTPSPQHMMVDYFRVMQ